MSNYAHVQLFQLKCNNKVCWNSRAHTKKEGFDGFEQLDFHIVAGHSRLADHLQSVTQCNLFQPVAPLKRYAFEMHTVTTR